MVGCRTLRCTRKYSPSPPHGFGSLRDGPIPFSAMRRSFRRVVPAVRPTAHAAFDPVLRPPAPALTGRALTGRVAGGDDAARAEAGFPKLGRGSLRPSHAELLAGIIGLLRGGGPTPDEQQPGTILRPAPVSRAARQRSDDGVPGVSAAWPGAAVGRGGDQCCQQFALSRTTAGHKIAAFRNRAAPNSFGWKENPAWHLAEALAAVKSAAKSAACVPKFDIASSK